MAHVLVRGRMERAVVVPFVSNLLHRLQHDQRNLALNGAAAVVELLALVGESH